MALTVFLVFTIAYLCVAATLVYRNPSSGGGFPMFVLVYLVFFIGSFFVAGRDLLCAWLGIAILNMMVQWWSLRQQNTPMIAASVYVASLFLWPIQLAASIHNFRSDAIADVEKAEARQSIGPLPATITGTVFYTQHIDADTGYDAVWFEEFGELEFMTDARRFDELRLAEGKRVTVTVDERDAPEGVSKDRILWILDAPAGG